MVLNSCVLSLVVVSFLPAREEVRSTTLLPRRERVRWIIVLSTVVLKFDTTTKLLIQYCIGSEREKKEVNGHR